MTTLTLTIKKKKLEKKLEDVANKLFRGNMERAAAVLLEKAIESEEEQGVGEKKLDLSQFKAVGMWADREDINDSVAWVNQLREKENNRSFQ